MWDIKLKETSEQYKENKQKTHRHRQQMVVTRRKGVGNDCGTGEWAGQRRAKGKTWDNCNRITMKYLIEKEEAVAFKS